MFGLGHAWVWALIGIALIIVELISGSLFFVFLGVGALVTALAVFLGINNLAMEVVIFCVSSILLVEKQMQAEREKRAVILQSEGEKQSAINKAEGQKQKVVLESEAVKLKQINEAQGQAEAIKAVAQATAEGIRAVATSIKSEGGLEAVQLRVAEKLVEQFGSLAKQTNTLILPANFGNMSSLIATALAVIKQQSVESTKATMK